MEYKAEDYINFIEQGRRDKISPHSLDLIAKRFRELERRSCEHSYITDGQWTHLTCSKCGDILHVSNDSSI